MDWYKVKASHTLYDGMTDRELAGWQRLMALTAHLEHMPTEAQMLSICSKNTLETLSKRFENTGKTLSKCLEKVLEDALEVCSKREYNKIKKRQSREKLQNVKLTSPTTSLTCPEQEKIREENIREENTNNPPTPFKGDTGLSSGSVVKKEFDFSFLPDQFKPVFMDWIEYKKSRREKYKNQKSLEAAYKHLLNLSNSDLSIAEKIVQQSMANNWAGLFELKNNGNGKGVKSGYTVGIDKGEYTRLKNTLFPGE